MSAFYVACQVENHANRSQSTRIPRMLVDTGSEHTWVSVKTLHKIGVWKEKNLSFVMANDNTITRSAGFAILRLHNSFTIDEVVFAEPGDLILLGARTLEGWNLRVHPSQKNLLMGDSSGRLMFCGDDNGLLTRRRLEKSLLRWTRQRRITLSFILKTGTVVKTSAENFSSARIEIRDDKRACI